MAGAAITGAATMATVAAVIEPNPVAAAAGCDKVRRTFGESTVAGSLRAVRSL